MLYAQNVIELARLNAFYARAVDTDDYRAAVALRERALEAQRSLLQGMLQPVQPDSADADLGAWLAEVAKADAARQTLEAQKIALTRLVQSCDGAIAYAAADPNPMLRRLNDDLSALMEDVAEVVERLGGARTVADVIAADMGPVWKELGPLRKSYDEIRRAQELALLGRSTLIDARSKWVDDDHASDAWIKNLDDVWPGWNQQDRTIRLSGDAPRRQPWPRDETEMLVWLRNSDAKPWIPTLAQLAELHAERHRRLNPPPKPHQLSEFPKQRVYATKSILG